MKAILISGSYKGLSIPKEAIEFIEKNLLLEDKQLPINQNIQLSLF